MSTADVRRPSDDSLDALRALQVSLLEATGAWARGIGPGPEVAAARHEALRLNHRRYVDLVPAYRNFAEGERATGAVSLEVIVNGLMLHGLFKSYDSAWLAEGDFASMTAWLGGVCSRPAGVDAAGITELSTWRDRLRGRGLFLSISSGTSGRMSFVPRDLHTWKALVTNGSYYTDESWRTGRDGRRLGFDCLVLGPRGGGIGILDAGAGLARTAERSHFLFDRVFSPDALHDLASVWSAGATGTWGDREATWAQAFELAVEFMAGSRAAGRRMLLFGPPFLAARFFEQIASSLGRLEAPEGSVLVTGGGWKSFRGARLSRSELRRLADETMGIEASRCIDAYSTSELNCTLSTCREGRYHVPPLVEAVVLDEALEGAIGRTGFGTLGFLDPFAASYPGFVITGDQGLLSRGECGCGLSGTFVEGEIERAEGLEIRGCGGALQALTV